MAFNPFHRFRKHQKAFFAVLTIVCMIVFVFSFGRGDLFQTALGWFGATRQQGQTVATLYKKDVTEGTLEKVRERRRAANSFMLSTVSANVQTAFTDLSKQVDKAEFAKVPLQVRRVLEERKKQQFMSQDPEQTRRQLAELRQAYQDEEVMKDPERVRMVDTLVGILSFEAWYEDALRGRADPLYFGGSDKPEGLLDFLVWKHQADRLGISLTEEDVRKEVNRAALNRPALQGKTFAEDSWVKRFLRESRGLARTTSAADLLEALTDEFRVSLAQEALVGVAPGVRAFREVVGVDRSPAVPTPDEFLNWYREQRTTLKVALLPVAVEPIARGLKAEPTEQELRNFFEKYKDQEPAPDRREPGFKEPRRIKIDSVRLNPDLPYFKKEAGKLARALSIYSDRPTSAALRFGAPFNAYAAGAPAVGWAGLSLLPFAVDPLGEQYKEYRSTLETYAGDHLGVGFDLRDQRSLAALTLGQALSAGFTRTAPLGVPVALSGTTGLFRRMTAEAFAGRVLAGAHPSPLAALGVALSTAYLGKTFEEAKPQLEEKLEVDLAGQVLRDKVAQFKEKVGKVKSSPEEARKVIDELAREYGLTVHGMKRPRSRYTITRDPELKDLKKGIEQMLASIGTFLRSQNRPVPTYTDVLFGTTPRDQFTVVFGLSGGTGLFDPQEAHTDKDTLLWWRSQDYPARRRDFGEVKKEVELAWRIERAAPLARDQAGRLADEVKKHNWPTDSDTREHEILSFLDGHAQPGSGAFVLKNVAQLLPPQEVLEGRAREYRPYRIPEDKEDLFPYPPPDLVKQLLTMKKPGDATVVRDRPVKHFYVAALLDRDVPTLEKFREVYMDSVGGPNRPPRDPLGQQYLLPEARRDFNRRILEQLRRESGAALDEDGNYIIPEGVRLRVADNRDVGD